ncbi:MAG TPA: tetratricopeptide repeat protein, partial [Patescibacteria group bacterium]|nr:tetratricopeptide repeat protein [Patescibacteria group bacterium]
AAGIGWIKKSADQGYVLAQRKLGEIYYAQDPALKRDLPRAAEYFAKAAAQGDLQSQYFTARFYHLGMGVEKDPAKAAEWYARVDQNEDLLDEDNELIAEYVMGAQSQLGMLYRDGIGVAKDPAAAARWFRRAAMLGSPGSQFRLGAAYETGAGVAADPVEAYRWYGLAASNLASPFGAEFFDDAGAKEASEAMARLDKTLPAATLALAKAAAEDELRLQFQLGSAYSWGMRPTQGGGYWRVGPP